jgi:pimeloyl-ACP methyl ester carboxylesterase
VTRVIGATAVPRVHWIEYPPVQPRGGDVVLLHGLGSSAGDWLLQGPVLQDRHRVIAVDLPGFGESPRLPGWPSIAAYAAAVTEAMADAGVSSAHVIGLSLGGAVALQVGMDRPSQTLSLTVVNAFASLHVRPMAMLRTAVRFAYVLMGRMDRVGGWVAQELFPDPQQADLRRLAAERLGQSDRASYIQAGQALARFRARRRLADIRCPTLIVAGELDSTIPSSAKEELARSIPGARLVRFPASGHATPIDDAQGFNRTVEAFLDEVEAARAAPSLGSIRSADKSHAKEPRRDGRGSFQEASGSEN